MITYKDFTKGDSLNIPTSCGSPGNKRGAIKDGHVFDVIRASGFV